MSSDSAGVYTYTVRKEAKLSGAARPVNSTRLEASTSSINCLNAISLESSCEITGRKGPLSAARSIDETKNKKQKKGGCPNKFFKLFGQPPWRYNKPRLFFRNSFCGADAGAGSAALALGGINPPFVAFFGNCVYRTLGVAGSTVYAFVCVDFISHTIPL
jgi:hypothetical protein